MIAPVKASNFTNISLHHGCIFVNFLKLSETHFDALLEFSKSSQKYFAKYLYADGCFVKTNAINCRYDNAMFPNTRAFAFTRQPMK